jgi:hypothetical protein
MFTQVKPNSTEMNFESNLKFFTSPDDAHSYRSGYQYNNFSFTAQSQLSINENYIETNMPTYFMFPTIPNNYKSNQAPVKNDINLDDNIFTYEKNILNNEHDQ